MLLVRIKIYGLNTLSLLKLYETWKCIRPPFCQIWFASLTCERNRTKCQIDSINCERLSLYFVDGHGKAGFYSELKLFEIKG